MAGLLGTLHHASTGMSVNQVAIQTTNQNITNMNNPGYTRQRVEQVAQRPYSQPGLTSSTVSKGQLGQGVQVSQITRIRNSFYDYQYRAEVPKYGSLSVQHEYYSGMEAIFNEPSDTSISSSISNLFSVCNEIGKDPNSVSGKNMLVENAKFLANNLTTAYNKLNTYAESATKQTETIVSNINNILDRLKELDRQINIIESTGKNPNDLLDAKDSLLDELSSKIDINNEDVKNALSDGKLELNELNGVEMSGELQGTLEVSKKIEVYKDSVENLIDTIANEFNSIYKTFPGAEDTKDFFVVSKDANGNVKMEVNKDFAGNPSSIVMSSDKANALYQLREKKINFNGENLTIGNYYANMVGDLGYSVQNTEKQLGNQSALLLNIDNARANVSSVSIDEEMVNLIQYQHAYSASAKVISTLDSLLDVVINGLIR